MKPIRRITIIAALLLAGCGGNAPVQPQASSFLLVPSAPNASPTPTPFQPVPWTPTVPFVSAQETLLAQLGVDSSSLTTTPLAPDQTEVPTADPFFLINTVAPLPTIDPSFAGGQDAVNFLLIGSDNRSGSSFRTDTMVVAILRPKEGQVSLISIPRDLWVSIPGGDNNRINTAYQRGVNSGYPGGGPGLLKDTIHYNLGIRIDHTAMVDFDGFRKIVDTLGGVDIPVVCPYTDWRLIDPSYNPENENNWYLYTVNPGVIHMDGDLALWYARSRSKSNDFDRGRRQQEVLRAIYSRGLSGDTLTKIPQLYNDLNTLVATDLGLTDILKLASLAPGFSNADIRSYYIRPPIVSSWITPGGAYVLLPDQAALQGLVTQALTASPVAAVNETITVEIMNGTLTEGWDALAASRLNYAGYVTTIKPADRRDYASSILVDMSATPDYNRNALLLTVLGLQPAQLVSIPDPNSPVQYRLILGYDYQPCFQPESLSP